jgi:large subunit ribosomal protein L10
MNREEKAAVIDQIADELGSSDAIFALDYRGITVGQIAELREKLRSTDTKLRVAKNSLSERAADQAGVADIKPMLIGPTALALVKGDAAAAAKILSDTARVLRGPLEFKGGLMSGSVLSAADLDAIAKLPTRDVLNAQLVGTIAAPLTPSSSGWPSSSARSAIRGWCQGPRHLLPPLQLTMSQLQRHRQLPRKSRHRQLR